MNESQLTDDLRAALDEATAGLGATPGMAVLARASGRRRRATRGRSPLARWLRCTAAPPPAASASATVSAPMPAASPRR
jgi:hypothetical protein